MTSIGHHHGARIQRTCRGFAPRADELCASSANWGQLPRDLTEHTRICAEWYGKHPKVTRRVDVMLEEAGCIPSEVETA
jgi:hypothetical protein